MKSRQETSTCTPAEETRLVKDIARLEKSVPYATDMAGIRPAM